MKKIYTLAVLAITTTGLVVAQNVFPTQYKGKKLAKQIKLDPNRKHNAHSNSNAGRSVSTWVSYAEAVDFNLGGTTSELGGSFLFTDSAVVAEFTDGNGGFEYGSPFVHSLGNVFDVTSAEIKNAYNVDLDNTIPYSVDSMGVLYSYSRVAGSTVTDTLIVTLYTNATAANMPLYYFTGFAAEYNSDTVYFRAQNYSHVTNRPTGTGATTVKIPLNWSDTTSFFNYKYFATNGINVPAGKLLGTGVTYKPGMAYTLNDTLEKQVNAFFFASFELNGENTYPTYVHCPDGVNSSLGTCDWNSSSIVPTDVRYNLDPAPGWNGNYVPAFAYTQPYSFESHIFTYKINAATQVGVSELESNSVALTQNMPNPANGTTTIGYELTSSDNVVIEVRDITGKQVMVINNGKQGAGKHTIDMDVNNLDAGVYFYSLITDNARVTKKMNVIK